MRGVLTIAVVTLAAMAPCDGQAQQAGNLEPILQVTIDPPRVVVGQRTTLRVDVLAPNYMTAPPELPAFQVRNAVTRQLQSVNRSEELNGTTYAGVRFEFAIYPQEPGSYAIASQTLTVRYAAEPPATREATMALPRIAFDAFIPDGASALNPFIAATRLTIEQAVQRSSDQLKAGDAATRIVTIKAEGTPAMLLPPVTSPLSRALRSIRRSRRCRTEPTREPICCHRRAPIPPRTCWNSPATISCRRSISAGGTQTKGKSSSRISMRSRCRSRPTRRLRVWRSRPIAAHAGTGAGFLISSPITGRLRCWRSPCLRCWGGSRLARRRRWRWVTDIDARPISDPNPSLSAGCAVRRAGVIRRQRISHCSTGCSASSRSRRFIPWNR